MSKYLYAICALAGFVLGWFVTSSGYKAEIADMELRLKESRQYIGQPGIQLDAESE